MNKQSLSEFTDLSWKGNETLEGLDSVIGAIADGAQKVHDHIQAAALENLLGETGEINVQGEAVQKLDATGSDIFVDVLRKCGQVAAVGSEEIEELVVTDNEKFKSFIVQMDPVDGSSNIDVAVTIGSIFGIWHRLPDELVTEAAQMRPGREQVAAAYIVYGSSTVLVVSTLGRVDGFTLDLASNRFVHTHPNLKFPETCQYYSTNEGNLAKMDVPTQRAVSWLRKSHSLRYVGSLVADFHRNLLKGGIFLYPKDSENPEGKLRLMYEANPLSFVTEQAGGAAYSMRKRILDIKPEKLHQRTPLILGNESEVKKAFSIIGHE